MIRIEFEPPNESICDCCGKPSVNLTRFVYKDDDAFAVYYAGFTRGHEEKRVYGLIGLGEWGDDEVGPEGRRAFAFSLWQDDANFNISILDAEETLWRDVTFLGKILDRTDALNHEWIDEVFHITDHIVTDDEVIAAYFAEP